MKLTISAVCDDPKTAGQRHPGCSGGICQCPCHGVRPPADFRERVARARAEKESQT